MAEGMKLTVDTKGNYRTEAYGYAGGTCIEKTHDIELLLGGIETGAGKKPEYFDPNDDQSVEIKLD